MHFQRQQRHSPPAPDHLGSVLAHGVPVPGQGSGVAF